VVEAHVKTGTPLPVNLRFCFEGAITLWSSLVLAF
jgi:hypothetical protein